MSRHLERIKLLSPGTAMATDRTRATILVVEDDESNRTSVRKILEKESYRVLEAEDGRKGLDIFRNDHVDLILTDLKMPSMDGLDLLRAARAMKSEIDVVMMTAHGTIETAVEAMKKGAYDFITKPFKRASLLRVIDKALERQELLKENIRLKGELKRYQTKNEIMGQSSAIQHVLDMISQVAPSSSTVLIQGDSGTGKELVAEAIHRQSPRTEGPFVKVSCAAIPENLLEAELFGYEKGAFTGAIRRKEGRFELAHRGTLFLDEIGEISPKVQVKLLRVLQEGEFERLGATQTLRCDVRIVAATNRNLKEAVDEKVFREDLFYRLNVITIPVAPLRSRKEDIPILANFFLRTYAAKNQKKVSSFEKKAMETLVKYHWPGNVRELENVVERAVVLAKTETLSLADLPETVRKGPTVKGDQISIPIGMPLSEVEAVLIRETLKRAEGDKTLAARLLGIAPRTIYRKLEQD